MARTAADIAPVMALLADHLDAVLAAGEDLLALAVDIEGARRSDGITAPWDRFGPFVERLKVYELTIVSRSLAARRWVQETQRQVKRQDPIIGRLFESFSGGTAALEDAVAELTDRVGAEFDGGLDPLAYMRTRGIIPADAGSVLAGTRLLRASESFLVARRIEIGGLLDMVAAFLDALDNAYGLFDEDASDVRNDDPRAPERPDEPQRPGIERQSTVK